MITKKMINLIRIFIRFIVYLFPRNKRLIVYGGSWDLFLDNAKHQFILGNEIMSDFQHVWLTNNQEIVDYLQAHHFQVVKSKSFLGKYLMLRAGFIVFDDGISYFANQDLSVGAYRINVWHGIPAKMIGLSGKDSDYKLIQKVNWWYKIRRESRYGDYCVSTSQDLARFFSYSFHVPATNIIISDYPRNRVLFMSDFELNNFITKYETTDYIDMYRSIRELKERKIVYMPTFRDHDKGYLDKAIPDWTILNERCKETKTTLFVKVHRVTCLPELSHFSNIRVMDNKMDIYPMLSLFDMLITDYSSIMFDFSLLGKKTVLYTFDIEQYRNYSRPLYDYYYTLLDELTHINSFDDFVSIVGVDYDTIKPFPVTRFFDKPNDYSPVINWINSLS